MNRRRFLALSLALPSLRAAGGAPADTHAAVVPGRVLRFPEDEGSHPEFKIEWWYVTGWLRDGDAPRDGEGWKGFQITFFRSRAANVEGNPSRFAPAQVLVAHAALSDPRRGRLLSDQRIARAGFGLAGAAQGMTDVWLDAWSLRARGGALHATTVGRELAFDLALERTQGPLLQGDGGYSRKGPAPQSASYYYSLPHLAVSGSVRADGRSSRVSGRAWFDHEWSTAYLEPGASGWDWIGINLDDGGALMAFRMRSRKGGTLWAGGAYRNAAGLRRTFSPDDVTFTPVRSWRSPRTGASYPVAFRVKAGELEFAIDALMDDQEHDTRATVGTVYWEGAVTARIAQKIVGRGYLELTGYWQPMKL
jgi:predicted secreted hydrolase